MEKVEKVAAVCAKRRLEDIVPDFGDPAPWESRFLRMPARRLAGYGLKPRPLRMSPRTTLQTRRLEDIVPDLRQSRTVGMPPLRTSAI